MRNESGRFDGPFSPIRRVDHCGVLQRPIATTARRPSIGTRPCKTNDNAPDVGIGPSVPTDAYLVHHPFDRQCVQEIEGQVCGHDTAAIATRAVIVGRLLVIGHCNANG